MTDRHGRNRPTDRGARPTAGGLRRRRLLAATAGGLAALAGCQTTSHGGGGASTPTPNRSDNDTATLGPSDQETLEPLDVRGAIYVPTRAFNHFQTWRDYDRAVIERDLGYATRLNLNAVRTWLSYEYWKRAPRSLERKFEHFLRTAERNGLAVVISLFDAIGEAPTEEHLTNDDLKTATHVYTPSQKVMADRSRWGTPRRYVRWFMDRYRDDGRLLAIEANNEPGWNDQRTAFTRGMFRTMAEKRGSVPLTVGSTSLANDAEYVDWGVDILQFHYNFPRSRDIYRNLLREANELSTELDRRIWLTEWQRVRPGKGFFSNVEGEARFPDYSSLAPVIHRAGMGNFFWSLMLKPAFSRKLRSMGVINGVFHENGAVWSLDDARAITATSGDPSFEGTERRRYPEWMSELGNV